MLSDTHPTGSELFGTSSEIFGHLWVPLNAFGNLQVWLCHLPKSCHYHDKNLMPLSQKKLAGII